MIILVIEKTAWFQLGEVLDVTCQGTSYMTLESSIKCGPGYYINRECCKIITKQENPEYFL